MRKLIFCIFMLLHPVLFGALVMVKIIVSVATIQKEPLLIVPVYICYWFIWEYVFAKCIQE